MLIGLSGYIGSGKSLVAQIILFHLTNTVRERRPAALLSWETFIAPPTPVFSKDWDESGWEQKAFAGKLKQMVSLLTGIPVEDLEKQEVKSSELGMEWWQGMGRKDYPHVFKPTVRDLLQKLGTEAVRGIIHTNAWVNALFADYKAICQQTNTHKCKELNGNTFCYSGQEEHQCKRFPNWVISDMRFPNEMEAVKARGGITVRINRPLTTGITSDLVMATAMRLQAERHSSETSLDNAEFDYVINNDAGIPELLEQVKQMLIHFKLI